MNKTLTLLKDLRDTEKESNSQRGSVCVLIQVLLGNLKQKNKIRKRKEMCASVTKRIKI